QPGDVFALFNQPVSGFTAVTLPVTEAGYGWANNLANNGTLSVVSMAPPSLVPQLAPGNMLALAWPADHVGWELEVQTNNPGQGLGTNWTVVAGSISTNQMAIPIDENNSAVFYRLSLP
ncbi:MAG TPA: hypothetical protein VL970_01920, partial [Candidatus Acidoferrales bacterium]|nr:hypothetical protein [Candidatus Acidoferrales bacterium]